MSWDPGLYERFRDERERPFHDLLAALPEREPRHIVDLGCGTGRNTALLAARYPHAVVLGIDRAATMLAPGRRGAGRIHLVRGDLRHPPVRAVDLLVSNAALHWVPDHEALIPQLAALLSAGGVFAFQVPANQDAPSHQAVAEVVATPRWHRRLSGTLAPGIRSGDDYATLLESAGCSVQTWDTVYQHHVPGPAAILDWLAGTTLSGALSRLDPREAAEFRADLLERLRAAYGDGPDVVFPFRRRFVIADRADV